MAVDQCDEVGGDRGQTEKTGPALLGTVGGQVGEHAGGLGQAAGIVGKGDDDAGAGRGSGRCKTAATEAQPERLVDGEPGACETTEENSLERFWHTAEALEELADGR